MAMPTDEAPSDPELHRVRRAILVVDVVESVRLMQANEADVIDRWRRFVNEVRNRVLPVHGGRMVKSLGDGMLLEFDKVPDAVAAAFAIQAAIATYNQRRAPDETIWLRAGLHDADVVADELDLFGQGVNLPARLAAIARPGGIVLSAAACDRLLPGLDGEIVDLGDQWLKHIDHPVRAFSIKPVGSGIETMPDPTARTQDQPLKASVAVIPLTCHSGAATDIVVGDLIADGVIAQLSRTPELTVLSRLSTAPMRDRDLRNVDLRGLANVRYLLSGSYVIVASRVVATVELADAQSRVVIWAERLACALVELLVQPCELLERIAHLAHMAMLEREAQRVVTQSLPTLESFSMLYGGVGLLHHSSSQDFVRAQEVLSALAERVPRNGSPHAWLAKWHCLRIIRGLAPAQGEEGDKARRHIELALERDPDSALAWALNALVQSWVNRALAQTDRCCDEALSRNPNESFGWLFRCTLRSWQGRGAEAVVAAQRALELSRLDPMRYYFETLSAAGYLADGQFGQAVTLCETSLRRNRLHTPTHRVLAVSQALAGDESGARATVASMLTLQPGYTVARYLDNYPGGPAPHAKVYAEALRSAGLPD